MRTTPHFFISLKSCQISYPFSFFSLFHINLECKLLMKCCNHWSFLDLSSLSKPVPTFLLTPSKGPFPISYSCYLTKDSMFWLYQVPEIQVLISSAWLEDWSSNACLRHSVYNILLEVQSIGATLWDL